MLQWRSSIERPSRPGRSHISHANSSALFMSASKLSPEASFVQIEWYNIHWRWYRIDRIPWTIIIESKLKVLYVNLLGPTLRTVFLKRWAVILDHLWRNLFGAGCILRRIRSLLNWNLFRWLLFARILAIKQANEQERRLNPQESGLRTGWSPQGKMLVLSLDERCLIFKTRLC